MEEALPYDPIYRDDCEFLAELGKEEPEFARLLVADEYFQNTFVIVDKSFLYLEFDTRNPSDEDFSFPSFVMMIDDPNSEIVQSLLKLHERIEQHAKLITRLDPKAYVTPKRQ